MRASSRFLSTLLIFSGLFLANSSLFSQESAEVFTGLPENINKIVSVSCVPCHTSKGGFMAKSKLNFNEWSQYAPEKQKARAEKVFSLLNSGEMPPKTAREKYPENIPTKEQIEAIKIWSESFKTDTIAAVKAN